jgi:hypothetical protein
MTKENLTQHIENMTSEQIQFLGDLLNFANYPDFQLLIKISGITEEQKRKIDSAIPSDYAKAIKDIYPDFNNGRNVYDYNINHYGSMLNLNNVVIENIKKVLTLETL